MSARATPPEWAKCIVSSTAIKMLYNDKTPLAKILRKRAYINDRNSGKVTFSDISRIKIGRQALPNRLDFFKDIKFDWCNAPFDHDKLGIELKQTFC